jgi:hypothetical protein
MLQTQLLTKWSLRGRRRRILGVCSRFSELSWVIFERILSRTKLSSDTLWESLVKSNCKVDWQWIHTARIAFFVEKNLILIHTYAKIVERAVKKRVDAFSCWPSTYGRIMRFTCYEDLIENVEVIFLMISRRVWLLWNGRGFLLSAHNSQKLWEGVTWTISSKVGLPRHQNAGGVVKRRQSPHKNS